VATALSTRGEIQSERKRIEAARMNDVAIHSERLPSIAGFADMGSIGTSIPNSTGTYDVGVSLRIPVFDSGRRNFRRAEIAASIRQEELRIAQLQKQIEFEVRQALLKLDMARGQVENAEAEVEMARQELEHRKRRVEGGVGVEPELTDAQIALTKAADARVAALYAWNDAHIELMQAMGTVHTLAQ
jgi:outer membrane protein TolC